MSQTAYALKVLRAAINGQLPVTREGESVDCFTNEPVGPWDPAASCWPRWKLGDFYTFTAFNDSGCYDYTVSLVERWESGGEDVLWDCDSGGADLVDLLTPEEQAKLAALLSYEYSLGEVLPDVAGVSEGGC